MKTYYVTYTMKQKERALFDAEDSSAAMKKATDILNTYRDAGIFDCSDDVEIEIRESDED